MKTMHKAARSPGNAGAPTAKAAPITSALAMMAIAIGVMSQVPAQAQVSISGRTLPLSTAIIAAQTAVDTCKANGYDVTATVVDVSGTPQVVLRGDHAVIHTKDSSFRKAYTVVTMGPIFHADTTSGYIGVLSKYPPLLAQSLASTPNVTALPGGVAFKVGEETIAGLGVGGSPGGDKDEVCAQAGVAQVAELLKK
ncbi:GlcG/HbpS family heme-binding protein [Herbaspirillum camelliae]|uniref:GlcG/HbpS family heme-binding protein n=1 Tax=Herbaspirillum camelliae TaxID=1892903 RepID=UPI000A644960|nr:heme-binding protein [Herbaspirillum camelliae]